MNIKHDKTEVHHLHKFVTTQLGSKTPRKGSNLGKREKIKRRKIKDPARFENSQKGSDLGKRGKIKDPARFKNS